MEMTTSQAIIIRFALTNAKEQILHLESATKYEDMYETSQNAIQYIEEALAEFKDCECKPTIPNAS